MSEFHNPYNFVRTPDRGKIERETFAGDYDPSDKERNENHSRYWEGKYTGTIPVRLRTQTPLFITDPNSLIEDNKHKTYSCLDHIPATALKGMLSSAYEIITNSRYRVFNKKQHEKKLGFRHSVDKRSSSLLPAMIIVKDGVASVRLYPGSEDSDVPSASAWIPVEYDGQGVCRTKLPSEFLKNEEDKATLILCEHTDSKGRTAPFKVWVVDKIPGYTIPVRPKNLEPLGPKMKSKGYAVVSGKMIFNKHYERFFFRREDKPSSIFQIKKTVWENFKRLVENYREVHEKNTSPASRGCKHGRHIEDKKDFTIESALDKHKFVYVEIENGQLKTIYPVQLSRDLYEVSPWECTFESLRPAANIDNLSPADRLFGWVNQDGSGAWKGKLHISAAECPNGDATENITSSGSMAILGTPKPAQARFYLGDEKGEPQKDGIQKDKAGYSKGKKIRGRKVYLHHQNFDKKKVLPSNDIVKGSQNRTIKNWIPAGKEFLFDIKFDNLTKEELGGLLWMLSLEDNHFFRLGYGKPLGLGSVRLDIDNEQEMRILNGEDIKQRYMSLSETKNPPLGDAQKKELILSFEDAMKKAYPTGFNFQEEFRKASKGVNGQISYAVIDNKPTASIYEWFVENEKTAGKKYSLPQIGEPLKSYPDPKAAKRTGGYPR